MRDEEKTKGQLISELAALRRRVAELESEARFRTLVEKMPDVIVYSHAVDETNTLIYVSPQVEKLFGCKVGELLQEAGGWLNHVHPADREQVATEFRRCKQTGEQFNAEYRVVKADGEVAWVTDVADMLRDEGGRVTSILGVTFDISPRKRAEEELEKLASVVKHSREFINLATLDGRMIFLNDAGAGVLGIDLENLEQVDVMAVIPEHLQEKVQNELIPAVIERGVWEGELQCRNLKTGKLTDVYTRAFSITDLVTGAPRFLANTSVDITERKRAEQALQESRRQLADIIALLPDATLVINAEGKVIAWNLAMEEMTGAKAGDMLGKSKEVCALMLHGQPRPMLVDAVLNPNLSTAGGYDHLLRRGHTLYAEMYVPRIYGGKGGHVWSTASPLFDGQGKVIGGIESIRDITERKEMESKLREREKELEARSLELEEINTALRVLLKRREEDQKEFSANVLSNLKELAFPYLEKLRNSALNDLQETYLKVLESHLEEIGAPFLRNLSHEFPNLSRTERQIASLIREGKRNRELSEIMGVSVNTILTHRYHLRTKLGLKNRNINLTSFLKSISTL